MKTKLLRDGCGAADYSLHGFGTGVAKPGGGIAYVRAAMQDGPTRATVRNPARGDLFIARGCPRFVLFFSGPVAEGTAVLRKMWPTSAFETCPRTAPLKNKTGSLGTRRPINRSPLRG